MYDPPGAELKITDFGIARLTDSARTRTGVVLGTPSFMSPEQLQGREVTGRSDLFSLAVTLYQLLTGQLPFRADSMPELMLKIAQDPHPRIRAIRPDLPEKARRVLRPRAGQGSRGPVRERRGVRGGAASDRRNAPGLSPCTSRASSAASAPTDTGRVREHNEDTIGSDPDIGLLVLADGMGGYNAGEVASGIAVKHDARARQGSGRAPGPDGHGPGNRPQPAEHRAARRHPPRQQDHLPDRADAAACEGMGTTVVAGLFFDDKLSIAHVGDSRLYRLRDSRLEQVTMDHSLLQELVARGFYSPEEAQRAANKNYVTRALGVEPTVEVEVQKSRSKRATSSCFARTACPTWSKTKTFI